MPQLVILTGPIAAGKNTVADKLAQHLTGCGKTVVVADVDDVAAMVAAPGAAEAGLWFAAHEAHGALVGQWMRSSVEYVVVVGPIYTAAEQAALTHTLPDDAAVLWIVIDATMSVTLARAQADPGRGLSRDPEFHHAAHRRFGSCSQRSLLTERSTPKNWMPNRLRLRSRPQWVFASALTMNVAGFVTRRVGCGRMVWVDLTVDSDHFAVESGRVAWPSRYGRGD